MLPDTAMRKWKVTLFEGSTGTKACLKGGILYFYTWYLGLLFTFLLERYRFHVRRRVE